MRILAVSDVEEKVLWDRFDADKWKGIDLVLSCGDLKSEYLQFLVTMLRVPVFYVRGNHDVDYATEPPDGCDDIDRRVVKYKGVTFLGLEGSMWYNGQPHQYTEVQQASRVVKLWPRILLSRGVDIIVTHAPPKGVHDAADVCHRGFNVYNRLISACRPQMLVHGHTHMGYYYRRNRESAVGETKVVDAYGYHIFDVEHR